MNTKLVLKLNGYILLFDVFAMVLPLIVAGIYKESTGMAFLPVMLLCLAVAIPLIRIKPQKRDLFAREGLVTVALAWIIMSFV